MKNSLSNAFKRWGMRIMYLPSLFVLPSCVSYQYVSLAGDLAKNDQQEFISENDTLRMLYAFNGANCPVTIDVYNKSDKPLYVDWNKSSVVLNDRSFPLNPNVSTISGDVTLTDVAWSNSLNYTSGTINGSISHPNQIAFIPPLSSIRVTPIHLMNEFLPKQPTDSVIKANLYTYSGPVSVKKQIYSTASSPLMFRCFITYSENSTFTDSRYLDHAFWAKESFRSMAKPITILPDQYYVSKTTGFGTVIGSIGVIILLVASAAVSGS
jgi:hypothetical protein